MLFNSLIFLLFFLPVSLIVYRVADRYFPAARLPVLLVLSLAFYSYWDWRFLPLLVLSVVINWLLAKVFNRLQRSSLVTLAIVINLLVLCYFKYTGFFLGMVPGLDVSHLNWVPGIATLPLGISFFTFHHVMYLVDLRKGSAPKLGLVKYGLYIAFFPQVLAGPLVRWREIIHQFDERPSLNPKYYEYFGRGLALLAIGLVKKVFIGDPLAAYANPVFVAAASGAVSFTEAWQAALAFTFQIYFDFSGYTDMAIGIGMLFGIVLPQNFNIPYRALSLQDFWRRWHMTLSRFLRDYLYIPLGGNRHGLAVQLAALLATMGLGGLWHGAGLSFIIWGLAHGAGLCAGLLWRKAGFSMPSLLAWLLTFTFVMLTFVLFRSETFDMALHIFSGMLGLSGFGGTFLWSTTAVAACVALIGPSSWELVNKLKPSPWLVAVTALALTVILFKLGDDVNYEFIYFQF